MPYKGKFSEDVYLQMVDLYNQGQSTIQIGALFGVHGGSVYDVLKKRGVTFRSPKISKRKYSVDESKFSVIDTEESAYWLGFLFADGCVTDKDVILFLGEIDSDHLEKFNSFLQSQYPVRLKTKSRTARVDIRSEQLVKNLSALGCIPRKSLTLSFPEIDPIYYSHFIRGYFDGDGSIHSQEMGRNPVISIVGTNQFLQRIREIIVETICADGKINKHSVSSVYYLRYFGACKVEAVRQWLYKDADIFLKRKAESFKSIYRGRSGHPSQKNYIYVDP